MPAFKDSQLPQPGSKPTWHPPKTERPVERPVKGPINRSTTPVAALAAPLKANVIAPEALEQPKLAYEPYNPYPARVKTAQAPSTSLSVGAFIAVTLMFLTGLILVGAVVAQHVAESKITTALRKAAAGAKSSAAFSFGQVKVSLLNRSVRVNNIDVTLASNGETIHIAQARVWGIDWPTLKEIASTRIPVVPHSMKIALDGIKIPGTALGPQAAAVLASMGFNDLHAKTYVSFHQQGNAFAIDHMQIALDQLGQFDLSLAFTDVAVPTSAQLARFKKDPRLLLTEGLSFAQAKIHNFDLTYRDHSFVQRGLTAWQQMGEASPLALVDLAIQVNTGVRTSSSADFVRPSLQTLAKFLRDPKEITLSVQPTEPTAIVDLLDERTTGSINELARRLNITVQ